MLDWGFDTPDNFIRQHISKCLSQDLLPKTLSIMLANEMIMRHLQSEFANRTFQVRQLGLNAETFAHRDRAESHNAIQEVEIWAKLLGRHVEDIAVSGKE